MAKRKAPKTAYKKGQSGNPNGRPKGSKNKLTTKLREELRLALQEVGEEKNKTFLRHVAEQAYEDKTVLNTVLGKLLPDLRSVEAEVKADGMTLIVECNMTPAWKKKDTS